jgi:hypothetical protein
MQDKKAAKKRVRRIVPAIPIDPEHLAKLDELARVNSLYTTSRNGAQGSTTARPHRRATIAALLEWLTDKPVGEAAELVRQGLAFYKARVVRERKPALRLADPPTQQR